MTGDGPDPGRLSFNQITADQLSLRQVVEGCVEAGIGWLAPWRHKLEPDSAAIIRAAGLRVSSLCRGGFFPAATEAERRERDADNRRAVEEAAELGTDVLVLVCGGARGDELDRSRDQVLTGIERLVPFAVERGVTLAIEPLHPMMVVERSVIVTLGQANAIAERFDPARGRGRGRRLPRVVGPRPRARDRAGRAAHLGATTSPTGWSRRPTFWPVAG